MRGGEPANILSDFNAKEGIAQSNKALKCWQLISGRCKQKGQRHKIQSRGKSEGRSHGVVSERTGERTSVQGGLGRGRSEEGGDEVGWYSPWAGGGGFAPAATGSDHGKGGAGAGGGGCGVVVRDEPPNGGVAGLPRRRPESESECSLFGARQALHARIVACCLRIWHGRTR